MNRIHRFLVWVPAVLLLASGGPALARAVETGAGTPAVQSLGKLPLLFVENRGRLDPRVAYTVEGATTTLYFTPAGVTFALAAPRKDNEAPPKADRGPTAIALPPKLERWVVKLDFLGARPDVVPRAEEPREAVISYFKGPADQWRTGLKTCGRLRYPELWPGIDLVYSGTVDRLKYHYEIKPGADPRRIRLAYRGADAVTATDAGQLEVVTPVTTFQDDRPVAWQEVDGRRVDVSAAYALEPGNDEGRPYGFRLGTYDPSRPLVLDPAVIVYAGYIGGSDWESGQAIAVDAGGNAYVTGRTGSHEGTFPDKVGPDRTYNGMGDAFVAKVKADGTGLVYAGYIGGLGTEAGYGIAVDGAGNAYVAGATDSNETSFPVKAGPDLTINGRGDAFIAKVNADGTGLVYAGYIGGDHDDFGGSVAVDGAGNAYLTGWTQSTETTFPVKVGPDLTYNGGDGDAFVAKVKADGSELVYAGYIGGSVGSYGFGDEGRSIAVNGAGNAYVTGFTSSTETSFPVKGGPDLTYNGGNRDAFVAKVSASGSSLVYAGYIGGAGGDVGHSIAVDAAGNAYVTGWTESTETSFPVKGGLDRTFNGASDAFVAKVGAGGKLVYAGYIGGSTNEWGEGIGVDAAGNAYVTGATSSEDFPVKGGPDLTFNESNDAFVAKVKADGSELVYAGYIGGSGSDWGFSIAVDRLGNAYVTGDTNSKPAMGFPVKVGPDLTFNGGYDVFVAKVSADSQGSCTWHLDYNGNGAWNGSVTDRLYTFGLPGDAPVVGNWKGGDNRDKVGLKRGSYWRLDSNGNGVREPCGTDLCCTFMQTGDVPVAGDWNGDGKDEMGIMRGDQWRLDYNGNGVWDNCVIDRCYTFGQLGDLPVAGDWNGDGRDEIGIWRNGQWHLDYNGNGVWESCSIDRCHTFGRAGDVPVAGNWDGDLEEGRDKIGVKRGSTWYLDYNGNGVLDSCAVDRCLTFGSAMDRPVVGDWNGDFKDEIGIFRVHQ